MPELSPKEYLDYLLASYADRPESYYRQVLTTPLEDGQAVLDWGCGLGRMLELVASLCPSSTLAGVDLNPEVVRYVKEKHPAWRIEVLPPPALRSPFPDAAFDRVFLLDVLEHCREPQVLLAECHRVLRPGGILTLSTPDRLAFHKSPGVAPFSAANLRFNVRRLLGKEWIDPTHVTEWSAGGLRGVLAASPFRRHDFEPVFWHRIPWARPPRKHYAFIVNLRKEPD